MTLYFKVGLEDLDVHKLALRRAGTANTGVVKSKITVMSQDEAIDFLQHLQNCLR